MNDDAKPLLAARRCLRTRHISSTCTACVDMCPEEALVVKERRLLFAASKCTGCGACTSVCPEDALIAPAFTSEALENAVRREAPQGSILFAAPHAEAAGRKILLPSLLHLSLDWLLLAIALGAKEIRLLYAPGSVDEENLSVITSRTGIVRKICDELHLPVELEAVRGAPKVDAGRRRFFSKLSAALEPQDTSSPQTQEMRSRIAKTLLEEAFVRIPEGRLRLIHALKRLLEKSGKPDSREAAKLFSAPRIDAAKCSGCALCPAACPTGALQSQGEGGTLRLLLNAGACTGCRLCADICFMNAVTLHKEASLEEVLSTPAKTLFSRKNDARAFDTWEDKLAGMINAPVYRT